MWKEEIDESGTMIDSKQRRPMIPKKKKIRAYIAKIEGNILDPSHSIELSRTISSTYSGYVHGASPQIMDMYGGTPLSFTLRDYLEHREWTNMLMISGTICIEPFFPIYLSQKLLGQRNMSKS